MSAENRAATDLPLNSFFEDGRDFAFNGEAVFLYHVPSAHTDGDLMVYFRGSDVLVAGDILDPTASAMHSLRALARRWLTLAAEIRTHDDVLDGITQLAAPTLREAFGIGADSAAEMMIVAGDNPTRVRSEAAFAKLCGACPIPAAT